LAYGIGEAVVLSKEVALVAAEGDAADLPKSCDPEVYISNNNVRILNNLQLEESIFFTISNHQMK
jgi:hypothetical protein